MPEDWFAQNAPKKSGGEDWFAANAAPKPPKSLAERVRESGPAGEFVGQAARFVKGAAGTVGTALALSPPGMAIRGPEATQKTAGQVARGIGEMFAASARELAGKPQPGETNYQALPLWERLPAAVATVMGSQPERVRQLEAQGKPGEAWVARLTVPLLNLAAGEIFRRMAGETLPPPETRTAKLTAATGTQPTVDIPASYQTALPRLDRAVRDAGGPPTNPKDITPKWLQGTVNQALESAENEFNINLKRVAANRYRAQSVADAIRSKKTLSTDPDAIEYNKVLEARALDFERDRTLADLNATRMRYFEDITRPEADILAQRGDAELAAIRAAEPELRNIVYNEVERATPDAPPGYFKNLKAQEAALIDLKGQLHKRVIQLSNADYIRRGTPWYMNEGVSFYGHPEKLRGGISLHGLQRVFSGGPQKFANRAVRRSFEPRPLVTRPRQLGAAALFGRVPSREPIRYEDEE